jgi:hypothetical protein
MELFKPCTGATGSIGIFGPSGARGESGYTYCW